MSYKGPSLRDLKALAEDLKKSYTGTTPDRLSFIALYDQLVTQTGAVTDLPEKIMNILLGALVFELADIKFHEYKGASPQRRVGWMWSSGSELYSRIKSKLNISKNNPFGYDERIFYLNEFYKYLDKVYSEEAFEALKNNRKLQDAKQSLTWLSKSDLKAAVSKTIASVLKQNSDQLENLVHGVPVLNALLKNMNKLEEQYASSSSNPWNPNRNLALNFIKFIIQSYQAMNPDQDLSKGGNPYIAASWHVITGSAIFTLLCIEKEYRVLSPTRSALFKACLQAIHKESLDAILTKDKIECLRALTTHITTLRDNSLLYKAVINQTLTKIRDKKIDAEVLDTQIKSMQMQIEAYLVELNQQVNQPSNARYAVSTATSYAVQYAVGPVMIQAGKNLVLGGIGLGALASVTTNPVGLALFGTAGTLMMSGVGRLVTEGVLNAATGNITVWLLKKLGNSVGDATAAVIAYPFSASPRGFEEMRGKLKHEDDMVFVNMVNTLLELDLISENDKNHIRSVLGIDAGCQLKPLMIVEFKSVEEKKQHNELIENGYTCKILT